MKIAHSLTFSLFAILIISLTLPSTTAPSSGIGVSEYGYPTVYGMEVTSQVTREGTLEKTYLGNGKYNAKLFQPLILDNGRPTKITQDNDFVYVESRNPYRINQTSGDLDILYLDGSVSSTTKFIPQWSKNTAKYFDIPVTKTIPKFIGNGTNGKPQVQAHDEVVPLIVEITHRQTALADITTIKKTQGDFITEIPIHTYFDRHESESFPSIVYIGDNLTGFYYEVLERKTIPTDVNVLHGEVELIYDDKTDYVRLQNSETKVLQEQRKEIELQGADTPDKKITLEKNGKRIIIDIPQSDAHLVKNIKFNNNNGKIVIEERFTDGKSYDKNQPFKYDPTFSIGGTATAVGVGNTAVWTMPIDLSGESNISTTVQIDAIGLSYDTNAGGNVKIGLYDGSPTTLLTSESFAVGSGTGVITYSFTTPYEHTTADTIHTAIVYDTNGQLLDGDTTGRPRDHTTSYAGQLLSTFASDGNSGNGYYVEVTYTIPAVPTAPTVDSVSQVTDTDSLTVGFTNSSNLDSFGQPAITNYTIWTGETKELYQPLHNWNATQEADVGAIDTSSDFEGIFHFDSIVTDATTTTYDYSSEDSSFKTVCSDCDGTKVGLLINTGADSIDTKTEYIKFKAVKVGSPTGTATINVERASVDIATVNFDVSTLTTGYTINEVQLDTPVTFEDGDRVTFSYSGGAIASAYVGFRTGTTTNPTGYTTQLYSGSWATSGTVVLGWTFDSNPTTISEKIYDYSGDDNHGLIMDDSEFPSASELKSYFQFEESSGTIDSNCSSTTSTDCLTSQVGTVGSGMSYSDTGILNDSLHGDGTSNGDITSIGSTSDYNFFHSSPELSSNTVNIWYKKDVSTPTGINYLFGTLGGASSGGYGYSMNINTSNEFNISLYNNRVCGNPPYWIIADTTSGTSSPVDTNWHMVTLVHDVIAGNDNFLIYSDGVYDETLVAECDSYATANANYELSLYTYNNGILGTTFDGQLDEFSIWKRSLDATEISKLYADGVGLDLVTGLPVFDIKPSSINSDLSNELQITNAGLNVTSTSYPELQQAWTINGLITLNQTTSFPLLSFTTDSGEVLLNLDDSFIALSVGGTDIFNHTLSTTLTEDNANAVTIKRSVDGIYETFINGTRSPDSATTDTTTLGTVTSDLYHIGMDTGLTDTGVWRIDELSIKSSEQSDRDDIDFGLRIIPFTELATGETVTSPASGSYIDTSVGYDDPQCYKVSAWNSVGESTQSNIMCGTSDSEASTPAPGGGGSPQSGSSGTQTTSDVTDPVDSALSIVSLFSDTKLVRFNAINDFTFDYEWDTANDLEILEIIVDLTNAPGFDLVPQEVGEGTFLKGTDGATADNPSKGKIKYTVASPFKQCEVGKVIPDCQDADFYTIPITVVALDGTTEIRKDLQLQFELVGDLEFGLIVIGLVGLIVIASGAIHGVRKYLKGRHHSSGGKKKAVSNAVNHKPSKK
jgi:hypothetical protein